MIAQEQRYPIGIQTFEEIRKGGYMYADKTGYVYELARRYRYVFLSRPRRFGKSLLVSTMKSYFEGRRDLFVGLQAGTLEKEWRHYPVLHFSLAAAKEGTADDLKERLATQIEWMEQKHGVTTPHTSPGDRLGRLIKGCCEKYHEQVVVLIDEYDAPLLATIHHTEQANAMRMALRAFYAPLKDCDPWLRFVFITGITKFSQLSIFSELNNLRRITMDPRFSAICGITEHELHTQWQGAVADMSRRMGVGTDEAYRLLKQHYDGYHFARDLTDVYNPFSLLNAFDSGDVQAHWFETATPTVLVQTLQRFPTDITRIENSQATADDFDAPTEQITTVLPLFYQSGYLTIKDYDPALNVYTLGYPNTEVRTGVMKALIPHYVSADALATKNNIIEMYRLLKQSDLAGALDSLKDFLAAVPYAEGATSEGHFQQLLYVVFSLMGMYMQTEVRTATGRIDVVWQSATDIYVMELKTDHPAADALSQIDRKGYLIAYSRDGRRLHKAGISFSTKTRTIEEYIIADE